MPRVARPDEMPRAALSPANQPAQINTGVASRIGQAGQSMGRAVEAIGGAFGEVVGRIGQANDANAEANARLDWLKGSVGIDDDLRANAGEDGAAWQQSPQRYQQLNDEIDKKYPISDPMKRANFQRWRELQTFNRGQQAVRQYQDAQRGLFIKGFDADVAGLEERISRGEVEPGQFDEYYKGLTGKLDGMNRTVLNQSDVEAKSRELRARLVGAFDRHLSAKDPAERQRFWDQVRAGQYEIDRPQSATPIRSPRDLGNLISIKPSLLSNNGHMSIDGLSPQFTTAFGTMLQAMPPELRRALQIDEAHRSNAYQAHLRAKYETGEIGAAARPGQSRHNHGEAVDISPVGGWKAKTPEYQAALAWIYANGSRYGIHNPSNLRSRDPAHFEMIRGFQPPAQAGGGIVGSLTAYAPQAGASNTSSMQGNYQSAKPGLDGQWVVRTLDDYVAGRSKYVTLAGNPSLNGKQYTIPEIEYQDKDGKVHVLKNVRAVVHDTGSAFKNAPEGRFDIPVARDVGEDVRNANHGRWKKAGVRFIPHDPNGAAQVASSPPPVSQRGVVQFAGLTRPGTATDAAASSPPAQASPAQGAAAAAGREGGEPSAQAAEPVENPLGELADTIAEAVAKDPNAPVSSVIDGAQMAELAARIPELANAPSYDSMTVGQLAELAKGQAAPQARPGQPQVQGGGIPMGRLAPGQVFTVKTPRGEISIPSEWINDVPPKMREQMVRQSGEAYRLFERGRQSVATGMMEDAETHMAVHGRPHDGYDAATVQAAFARNPEALRKHMKRMAIAQGVHQEAGNFADMPSDEIAARLENLESRYLVEGETDAGAKKIVDLVKKRGDAMLKQRERDPAGSVEGSKEVQSVRGRLAGGQVRNKMEAIALMDARMEAQRRLDVPEGERSPISQREALALAPSLRGLNPGDALASIQKLHDRVKGMYGEKYSGLIVDRVIATTIREKQKRDQFGAMLRELDEDGKVSPVTLERMRNLEQIGRREGALSPGSPQKPEQKGVMGRLYDMLPSFGGSAEQSGPTGPTIWSPDFWKSSPQPQFPAPTPAHIELLKKNPQAIEDFEKKFGPGSADRAVPGLRRMILMNQAK